MSEFKNTTLRNKINIKHGFSFKGEFFAHEGDFILLTPGNFHEVGGFKFDENKAKFYKGEIPDDYICEKGDLIVAMTEQAEGLLGSSAIVPLANRFLHNQRIGLVKVNENEIDKMFLYHLMNTKGVREQIRLSSSGSKVKHTSPDRIYDVIVNLPSLPTQQKIGSVLSALDAKIELNSRINVELEAMAKSMYDYWFVQFDFPDTDGKPYKTNGGKMVWNEELKREIPEGWEFGTLLDIAEYVNGLPCQKYRPIGTDVLRVIKIREMHEGFSADTELVRADIPQKAIVENGDVLFSWSASLEVQIWSKGRGALNQHVFKVTSNKYPKSFYYYQLVNYLEHFKMMAENRKTTMGHITQEHLQQSRIAIPSTAQHLVAELENRIAPIFEKKVINDIENQHLSSLRDWLLPMLMNGQVTVNNTNKLEEQTSKIEKKIEVSIAENKKAFAKQVLGGKIVSLFQNDPHFTNIKFQKIQYLAEHVAEVDLNWNYYYQAAGPYDNIYMHTISDKLKTSNWFAKEEHKFIRLEKQGQIDGYYQSFFQPVVNRLDNLFSLLADVTDIDAEIIATLYAVWNNRIILNQPIAEELLIEDFYNWSDRKLLYTPEQLQKGLQWLHTNNIVPNGFGKEMKKAKGKK